MLGLLLVKNHAALQEYLNGIVDNPVHIFENRVTEKDNDYFILTEDEELVYVQVEGKPGSFSHEETVATRDKDLLAMGSESLKILAEEEKRRKEDDSHERLMRYHIHTELMRTSFQ